MPTPQQDTPEAAPQHPSPATVCSPDCCGSCHHPATVHFVRCAVDACSCNAPDFQHRRYFEQDAIKADLLAALEALTEAVKGEMRRFWLSDSEAVYPNEDVVWPLIKAADAIIARARGGQQ